MQRHLPIIDCDRKLPPAHLGDIFGILLMQSDKVARTGPRTHASIRNSRVGKDSLQPCQHSCFARSPLPPGPGEQSLIQASPQSPNSFRVSSEKTLHGISMSGQALRIQWQLRACKARLRVKSRVKANWMSLFNGPVAIHDVLRPTQGLVPKVQLFLQNLPQPSGPRCSNQDQKLSARLTKTLGPAFASVGVPVTCSL